jgi:hypothetical protein
MAKWFRLWVVAALLVFVISACSGANNENNATEASEGSELPVEDSSQSGAEPTLSRPMQLAIGTILFENTEWVVSAEQARELLALWKAYRMLSSSETAAAIEVEAVLGQIEEAMTPEQLEAIEAMDISLASMAEAFQSLGIENDFRLQTTPDSDDPGIEFLGPPEGVEPGTGMNRGGDGAFMGPGGDVSGQVNPGFGQSGTPDPSLMATRQAMSGGFGNRNQGNPMVLQAVITYLEGKTQPPTETPSP